MVVNRWGLVLLMLLAVSACTAEPEPTAPIPSAAPKPTGTADCPESGVRVTTGVAEAAMGLRVQGINLTNCGQRPYHLDGYPLLRVLDKNGEPLDVRLAHGSAGIATIDGFDAPPQPLTLQPGDVAQTHVVWRNTTTSADAPAVGEYLSIAPAEGRPWQPVQLDDRYRDGLHIDLGNTGKLGVRAWHHPSGS